jgi:hypothetical protein
MNSLWVFHGFHPYTSYTNRLGFIVPVSPPTTQQTQSLR